MASSPFTDRPFGKTDLRDIMKTDETPRCPDCGRLMPSSQAQKHECMAAPLDKAFKAT